ncbi:MAG: cysteine--tRNA ligase [Ignavibacteriales bacterium CG_4_9_14_3_um_filter_34_10]|nr:MAG: cysteine--tRNA ligase [Ignavibacteriales bacterium CG_4_9_14_3_um_filter_34_10]
MKIYNTLTKQKDDFKPINPPLVTFYACGPTVYDFFHIGNGRTFIMTDVVRRYLIYKGFKVKFAMNLTDVDDKIIKKANSEGKSASDVSKKYSDEFFKDLEALKIRKADFYPRATEHIIEITNMISKLESNGIAYNVNGDVFFEVNKFDNYGKLSGKNLDELEIGARVEINDSKKNSLDFALWKKAKEGEPYWESPWGKGRPGWHIECSAMSTKHLGETIDIHAGGNDLIFPHHENEIAQSECSSGKEFVKYWIHFGFLNIKEEKMSKSLGNFYTARDILKKYSAEAIRMLFCQTHYRGPMNFSFELLDASEKGLAKLQNIVDMIISNKDSADEKINSEFDFAKYYRNFEEAMDDDFNTPQAVAVIFDFVKDYNKFIVDNNNVSKAFWQGGYDFLYRTALEVLGIIDLGVNEISDNTKLTNELINLLLEIRAKLKAEKKYLLSDEIRNRLGEIGVSVKDTKDGSTFRIN